MPPALLPTYPTFSFTIVRGAGDRLWDENGQAWIDFYGGHCVCSTGHCHPRVVEAIERQARELIFYSAAGRTPIRERAAVALVAFAGAPMASVFFCNSGAEANENALKVAKLVTGRSRLVSFRGGWHGRTLLALAATDDPPIRDPYADWLPRVDFLDLDDPGALEHPFEDVAAVILEPAQSMAGVRQADPDWLRRLVARCRAAGALVIFDEVQTGFGRLGSPFAFHALGSAPDMLTCAKGIASGVPMGATLMTEEVAERLGSGDLGSTFGGGPLACAALLATIEVIRDEDLMGNVARRHAQLRDVLGADRLRGAGLLLGWEAGERAADLKRALIERRILVGGSHDPGVLRLMPPLVVTEESVDALTSAVREFERCGA